MSSDSAETQRPFIDAFGLEFAMVPDPDTAIIDAYGVRDVLGIKAKRTTFLVAPDGRIAHVWNDVVVEGHAEDVLAQVRALRQRGDAA